MPFQLCGNILQSGLVETGFDISIGDMIKILEKKQSLANLFTRYKLAVLSACIFIKHDVNKADN